jgi:diguanylate cyclase
MPVTVYLVLTGIITLTLLFLGIYSTYLRRKNFYAIAIALVLFSTVFSLLFYMSTLIHHDKNLVLLFYGFYFFSLDIVLFFLYRFGYVILYNRRELFHKIYTFVMILFCSLDALAMLLNWRYGIVFTLTGVQDNFQNVIWWTVNYKPLFYFHLAVCYALALPMMYLIIKNSVVAPKIFRIKYLGISLTYCFFFGFNAIGILMHWKLNYSILMFFPMGAELYYMTFYALKNGILNNLLQNVTERFSSGIACFDFQGNCIYLNQFSRSFFGNGKEGIKNAEKFYNDWLQSNVTEVQRDSSLVISYRNQIEIYGKLHLVDIEYHKQFDKKNRIVGSYLCFDDKTKEIEEYESEKYKASHDSLTRLLNREGFFKDVEDLLRDDPYTQRYLIVTDFENFKMINDLFGKELGDKILRFESMILRRGDFKIVTAGHISGDKFAFVMNKRNFDEQKLVNYIQHLMEITRTSAYKLKLLMGVYEITNPDESVISMYDRAYLAITTLRANSDKILAYYVPEFMDNLIYEKKILGEFHSALAGGQFKMFIQPQVRAEDGKITGGEALVRWEHPQKALLTPDKFVKILEKNGFIYEMDNYIWESAAKKLAEWQNSGNEVLKSLSISVNISTKDFYHADLYKIFTTLVQKYNISPKLLKLEVTETVLVQDVYIFRNVLNHLKKYGFIIEMDDFGSGYSSLNALKDFQMDVLKIDMEFLRKTENKELASEIIALVIKMAKSIGMKIITEGVETKSQVDFLTKAGCDVFQGYYFAKPMPEEDFVSRVLGNSKSKVS